MSESKKVVFVTGTRADFGKLKSLIGALFEDTRFEVHLFATGMHMEAKEHTAGADWIRVYPSVRFEYFLVLLKNASLVLGNSSMGIREASALTLEPVAEFGDGESHIRFRDVPLAAMDVVP